MPSEWGKAVRSRTWISLPSPRAVIVESKIAEAIDTEDGRGSNSETRKQLCGVTEMVLDAMDLGASWSDARPNDSQSVGHFGT